MRRDKRVHFVDLDFLPMCLFCSAIAAAESFDHGSLRCLFRWHYCADTSSKSSGESYEQREWATVAHLACTENRHSPSACVDLGYCRLEKDRQRIGLRERCQVFGR